MKENCLDIGTIQAFLDRELEPAESSRVADHISACNGCAVALSRAEDESALVFSALEREIDTLVPTQRLWTRINDAIETERREAPWWQKALAYARIGLANPSLAMAAGLVIVAGIFAVLMMNRPVPVSTVTPANEGPQQVAAANPVAPIINTPTVRPSEVQASNGPRVTFERASYRPTARRIIDAPVPSTQPVTAPATNDYMPGEESYLKTIAILSKTVDQKKDDVMRPSQRIAYERDMAVVNDAIAKMKQEVKKNPKNGSARQVLYTSYQNKIDLLNSVSQKEELMASLR